MQAVRADDANPRARGRGRGPRRPREGPWRSASTANAGSRTARRRTSRARRSFAKVADNASRSRATRFGRRPLTRSRVRRFRSDRTGHPLWTSSGSPTRRPLREEPPGATASSPTNRPAPPAPGAEAAEDGPLPSRAVYEPMTDAKRKKIEKRVKKVEKTKTSYAGAAYGVSFGTVLAISLFTWRIYRTVNKIGRLASSANAVASAPGRPLPTGPGRRDGQGDRPANPRAGHGRGPRLARPGQIPEPRRHGDVGRQGPRPRSPGSTIEGLRRVYVLDPTPLGNTVLTAQIAVKLPTDPAQRKACMGWEAQYLEGGDLSQDFGQTYLLITTD